MLRMLFRSMKVQGLFIFVMAFVVTVLTAQTSTAHAFGWLWYSSSATFVTYQAPIFRAHIQAAAREYDTKTELTVWSTSEPRTGAGYIKYLEGDWGATSWSANTWAYNAYDQECVNTTLCTASGYSRAQRADIYLNLNAKHRPSLDAYPAHYMLHEPGHAFGMRHDLNCGEVSVMNNYMCKPDIYSALQTHDINFINANY